MPTTQTIELYCLALAGAQIQGQNTLTSYQVSAAGTVTINADDVLGFLRAGFAPMETSFALADGANLTLGTTTGSQIGTATSQKLGFFGATPVVQQAGATPAATTAVTTAATSTTPYGYATSTQANNVATELAATVTAVNALITQLTALGLIA